MTDLTPAPSAEERNWAVGAHLSALLGAFTGIGAILGPLIVWLIKKDTMPFVNDQGKEALNFQITVLLAAVVCVILILVAVGMMLLALLCLLDLIFIIIAAVKASEGVAYRYPINLRLIK
ncbi:MAG TPA: DUF4870 domain-containing protein [Povalibacter sp.]